MADQASPLAAVVEAQLNWQGLRWLASARALGWRPAFVTSDLTRYHEVHTFAEVFGSGDVLVIEADTNSALAVEATLRPYRDSGDLAGLLTQCDYNLPITAEVARALGLPGVDPSAAGIARNKLLTRQTCRAAGVACPEFVRATSVDEAIEAGHKLGLPCVVKPMTESASTDVALCETADDIASRYAAITAVPQDRRGQPRPAGVLVEEYCVGYEVSVETLTIGTEITVLGVSDKSLSPHPYFVEIGDVFPSALPDDVTGALAGTAVAALRAIGHDFGPAHTEVRMTADGPRLIEINSRLGGADIPDLIEAAFGIDTYAEVWRMHAGERPDYVPKYRRAAATRWFTAPRAGVLDEIRGVKRALGCPGVVHVAFDVRPGDRLELAVSNHELCGYVLATAPTPAEALRRAETAANFVSLAVDSLAVEGSPA